ncbi:hypothetical protein PHYBLDRAFT_173428 [Phycomyces blakesleeanus NRRL 1555(-)]|uniref:Uncharacterized protein n=1 Tax=Phycomyces blakesleeanus (strain ATCC 8743b / DSM 1359 / FGSC 10004 / NBRC 33097 / NRRL 1555) TaxID=763407 RepID=A0A162TGN0_PHYB8|nr:hypothetical protein PHYBLDRAFT_173428 [Phycomyces blakesleeanus NRRL 1555(-)]OAD68432.1 hypothetical protein PHYBLDRAFT_173428 [Phycomyces blakesleeanus NRRL 1555(-)]|eukprot:XP_018286472.1 hypothetical protein PHYBLDRAFT_173428 [Phycomyces blakesleeanus NRRL 1555(-)]
MIKFKRTTQTNGVGTSIIKMAQDTSQEPNPRRSITIDTEGIPYIHNLPPENHEIILRRHVLIDPGQRDLLYRMHKKSTVVIPYFYRYTFNQQRVQLKRGRLRRRTNNIANFTVHSLVRAANSSIIISFYASITLFEMLPTVPSNLQARPQSSPILPQPDDNCDPPWSSMRFTCVIQIGRIRRQAGEYIQEGGRLRQRLTKSSKRITDNTSWLPPRMHPRYLLLSY